MSDHPPASRAPQTQAQMWNRPPPLKPAGPLVPTDTIAVTRNGVTTPVPLSVLAAYIKGSR